MFQIGFQGMTVGKGNVLGEWVSTFVPGDELLRPDDDAVVEHMQLVIQMAPARRLLDTLRFRSFKLGPDYQIWEQATEPLRERLAAGWQLVNVELDWGGSIPLTPTQREAKARELLLCHEPCQLVDVSSGMPGRGKVTCYLERP